MTNFLNNIKNHYLRVAIAELVDEAMKTYGGSAYQFSEQWDLESIAQSQVFFTEMVAGEWYLCHDLFQHAPEQYTLFIFQDNEQATVEEGLPNCLRQAVFIPPHAPVQRLKDEIVSAIQRPLSPQHDPAFNRLRRCINCACKSVSDAQTKVIYAFSIGLSPHEVAAALKISHKTIHSHKKNIMNKFNLHSRQQFNNLVKLLARR
ncbi:LuxR family transcriptional regulator KbvR [Klebsiella quasipneumoniae]|jgi:DNA-binding CsgD family transcriptional regulator|uniref:LuxR family transcriptional regulator KbvR n=1 Tax=Klebsiella quasipneumoniae TaxID=1463165 RepID=UPI001C2C5D5D|nr:LuxR family transcriptional regulator KbvR [Klebsiella quasipneumoniae]MBV0646760.1 LuxR family transcriptional regulator KbvR [Klebsiella quasipneumoniae]MCJ5172362.1 LuxR family transcriptional regulator KbvR [Klebsiella quasipneumoniae]MCJ5226519.1 LuxR family transcriptional regulator KbvR [Klebsiella quasipneumoniae]MDD7845253.1 LuxR family transcriptional regulator KbvR [Klebsiella quasipneumoniae]MDD7860213.1 LuxR family transcriptional regulator KbvR [Klebsiella quasipneumoniae]